MYKVSVSCESLPRSHSAVVCGGWHLALRLSCLPPPQFSALQWDHVVLLISQQWPYSLPFPLLSLPLATFPHSLLSSSPPSHNTCSRQYSPYFSPAVTSTLFTLLGAIPSLVLFSPQPGPSPPAAHSPSSLEPWLSLASSPSFTKASKYPLAATVTPEEDKSAF